MVLLCLRLVPGGNTTPPVSSSDLCCTICSVLAKSSPALAEHFMGMWGPKGVLCASNYEESVTATWFQGRRRRRGFLPPQRSARGSSPCLDPLQVPSILQRAQGSAWHGQQPKALSNLPPKLEETDLSRMKGLSVARWLETVRGTSCTVTDKQRLRWTFIMGYVYFPHDLPGVRTLPGATYLQLHYKLSQGLVASIIITHLAQKSSIWAWLGGAAHLCSPWHKRGQLARTRGPISKMAHSQAGVLLSAVGWRLRWDLHLRSLLPFLLGFLSTSWGCLRFLLAWWPREAPRIPETRSKAASLLRSGPGDWQSIASAIFYVVKQ